MQPIPKTLACHPSPDPAAPLWVARLRPVLTLAQFRPDPTPGGESHTLHPWHPHGTGTATAAATLSNAAGLARLALDTLELPAPASPPAILPAPAADLPPPLLLMRHPGTGNEYILDPHTPRLWRLQTLHGKATGAHPVTSYGHPIDGRAIPPAELIDFYRNAHP